jgi:hypothetical protein
LSSTYSKSIFSDYILVMENFDIVQRSFSWSVSEQLPKFESRYLTDSELMLVEIKGEGLNIRLEKRKNEFDTSCWMKVDGRQVLHYKGNITECLKQLSKKIGWWKDPEKRVKINL